MELFNKDYKDNSEKSYEDVKKCLKPKDGMKHVVMINISADPNSECDNKYTAQMNKILAGMQKDEYEIIDIKIENYLSVYLVRTLIIYK